MNEQLKALLKGTNALKSCQEDMQKSQEETKQEMQKGQQGMEKEKINSVEKKIALKIEEKVVVIEEKIEKKRMEDLEKKLLAGGKEKKNKSMPVSAFPEPVLVSPVPLNAFTGSVKLSAYDGKMIWVVYKSQFSIISEANGWTEGVKAYQLAASLRGEAAEVLQTLPETERLNLNSLYNALDLRLCQKYSKDYARLQMKTRLQKTGESLQEYASEVDRLANLAFSDHPATVCEAAHEASSKDRHSIRIARVTADAPCESPWRKDVKKLKEESQDLMVQLQNRRRRSITCWGVVNQGILEVTAPETIRKIVPPSAEDQQGDPEIKPIIEFKELSDEKPSWQDIASFQPTTKRYWALWDSLYLKNGLYCCKGSSSTLDLTIRDPSTTALRSREKLRFAVCKRLREILAINKTRTTALHPQSDGMVQRFNRTILNSLYLLVSSNQKDWDKKLPFFLLAYRSAAHETTGCSPSQMLFGRDLRLPADLPFSRPPVAPLAPEEYIEKLSRYGWRKYIIWLGKESAWLPRR
ncbi:uncharacterized protein TNCV_1903701 [Trichonephila clavipes]|nr:uncharacterized protein TNCV_1903701 [Trichonephila clavipes]